MANSKVYLVHLRRPRMNDANEQRSDPYYEFGSFGCTGCHSRNLFNPRRASELVGSRLAFMQGGNLGFRLVLLTPPIAVKVWADRCEASWSPATMPFKYRDAPVLAYNNGESDFPLLEQYARKTLRTTLEAGLSSRFRTRSRPLPEEMANEMTEVYERLQKAAKHSTFAQAYYESLPKRPPRIDHNRKESYRLRIEELTEQSRSSNRCGRRGHRQIRPQKAGFDCNRPCS